MISPQLHKELTKEINVFGRIVSTSASSTTRGGLAVWSARVNTGDGKQTLFVIFLLNGKITDGPIKYTKKGLKALIRGLERSL